MVVVVQASEGALLSVVPGLHDLGKFPSPSMPQSPHLENGDGNDATGEE